ncbi:hypothetical protein Taro_042337 [Colocasia esculenta]|uniref:Uncharacterized protein n=1 Tax=Colocasia esculenta TaxID=4460 RepID=A0A843WZC5_COLES|nr:hypothetical protein [Colocasia esculenta]
MTNQTLEEVNIEIFQEDLVDDVELTTHTRVDESEELICLSKGNEVEEVDPYEIKESSGRQIDIDVGQVFGEDSDEVEEYNSDECEDDDEYGVELDISFWSFCASSSGIRLGSIYASSSYGSSFWSFCASSSRCRIESSHASYVSYHYDRGPSASVPLVFLASVSTVPEVEDAVSLQVGGGSFYDGTLREVLIYVMFFCKPPTFQEVFDKTHKKNGTNQCISDRAWEVVESNSQQMTETYAEEEEQLQLDPEVWVTASGAPKKSHMYGFGHSMDMSRVLSSASSLGSQATSAFTKLGAQRTCLSEMMGFIRDEIIGSESPLVHTMHTFGGQKLEILIRSASGLFEHDRGNERDLWKLTEFRSDFRFELGTQIHIKQHGQGDDYDLRKLTEFKSDSRFELGTQIHIKQEKLN